MGRIADLLGAVAAAAEDGGDGLELPPGNRALLLEGWSDDDIDDALGLVTDSLLLDELVEAAGAVSSRLLVQAGALDTDPAFAQAQREGWRLSLDQLAHLARELDRLEEVLEVFEDAPPRDRSRLDGVRRRLMEQGIETAMRDPSEGDGSEGGEPS
jgi:hypothetical protein